MEDDGDDKDDSKRRTRNISEKKRRDQFNLLVNELSTMVSASNRKMDKSTVLKSTISFLKNHNEITVRSRVHDVQEDWKPAFLSNVEFTYLVLEALEGFVIVFSVTGEIHYVSENITSLLGYNVVDLLNKSIFDLTFEGDRSNLYNLLRNPRVVTDPMQRVGQENEIRFQCHLRRGTLDFRDESTYELIEFNGHFRTNTEQPDREDMSYQPDDSRLLFVCTGRLSTPQLIRDVSLADSTRSEFTSRHSLEWKFLFLDHRAPPIIGYLPFEVLGTSGYDYYHFDDLEKVVSCHESLMRKGELTSCYYRFLTKGQQWIWLQTRFYITYHQWNSKPEFVVCTHRVVNYADVARSTKQEEVEIVEKGAGMLTVKEQTEDMPAVSPSYMSDASEAFASCQTLSQSDVASAPSLSAPSTISTSATAGTVGSAWRAAPLYGTSDTTSMSGSSRSSQHTSRETRTQNHGIQGVNRSVTLQPSNIESRVLPQWSIGSQYLEPGPFVDEVGAMTAVGAMTGVAMGMGAVPVGAIPAPGVQGVLSLPTLPIIVAPDQAQIQEQLQQKHEKLQQMIVRQQEELRQVKEQLLLARLGILHPLPNMQNPYTGNEIENTPQAQPEVYEEHSGRQLFPPYPPQPPDPHLPQ